ncbi:MAG: hypothetical protein LBP98_09820 [Tannerella sp.]|jgi:hypothetical protein|nr:hypothetical protein [Tannerella sp.]
MKPLDTTASEIGKRSKHKHTLFIRYSKAEFFCEGQEKRLEHTGKANSLETVAKGKRQDRFSGHFNMFL